MARGDNVEKQREEVADQQRENALEGMTNVPDHPVAEAHGQTARGKDKTVEMAAVGGEVILTVGREKVRFSRDGWVGFVKRANRVGQGI